MILKVAILSLSSLLVSSYSFNSELDEHWQQYKAMFSKNYTIEEEARRLIWEQSVTKIMKHNLEADMGKHSFWLGLNPYSDMLPEEIVGKMCGFKGRKENSSNPVFLPSSSVKIPEAIDWRKGGLVTEVKNQRQCGSCWAFSATGSLEGQHKKHTGHLVELSEQNLVDCSKRNSGCSGGSMDRAFDYIKNNGGIDTERSYPYEAKNGNCRFRRGYIGATCRGYVRLPRGDENALKIAVATIGPVSVAIDANHGSFFHYRSGILHLTRCSSTYLDHAVLVVGYGTQNGQDYWIVKNSWGKHWGDKGYILMSRNKGNQCGIASYASYPLV